MVSESVHQLTIVIVEDHDAMRQSLAALVQATLPHAVVATHNDAPGALELCMRCKANAVLLDIELPNGDGIALAAEMKAALPTTLVVIVTSHDSAFVRARTREAGADYFVEKQEVFKRLPPILLSL